MDLTSTDLPRLLFRAAPTARAVMMHRIATMPSVRVRFLGGWSNFTDNQVELYPNEELPGLRGEVPHWDLKSIFN